MREFCNTEKKHCGGCRPPPVQNRNKPSTYQKPLSKISMHLLLLAVSPALRLAPPVMQMGGQVGSAEVASECTTSECIVAQAFSSWRVQQEAQAQLEREIKRLAHTDVPLWFVFEGTAQPGVIPGSGTTSALHNEAARVHDLDVNQRLRFLLDGKVLPVGVDISESPLANTENLAVHVMPSQWPARRGYRNVASASGRRVKGVAAIRVQRGIIPPDQPVARVP